MDGRIFRLRHCEIINSNDETRPSFSEVEKKKKKRRRRRSKRERKRERERSRINKYEAAKDCCNN